MSFIMRFLGKTIIASAMVLAMFMPNYANAYDANDEIMCSTDVLNSDESAQFQANWEPISWTVHYASGHGLVIVPDDKTCYYDATCTAAASNEITTLNALIAFRGWTVSCKESDGTTPCTPTKNSVSAGGDISNITNIDGAIITLTADVNDCQTTTCTPTNATCTPAVVDNTCACETTCLPGYGNIQGNGTCNPSCSGNTITLVWNNGGHGGNAPSQPASCVYGETFTMPAALSEANYGFQGWTLNGNTYAPGDVVNCNHDVLNIYEGTATITASWTQTGTTCAAGEYLPANTSVCAPCPAGYFCPNAPRIYEYSNVDQGNTACTKGSYTNTTGRTACFACENGTTTSGVGSTSCDATCTNSAHVSNWYAQPEWNPDNSVSFVCVVDTCDTGYRRDDSASGTNGDIWERQCVAKTVQLSYIDSFDDSTISTQPTSCTYDTNFNLPDTPTRTGYKFAGWELVE